MKHLKTLGFTLLFSASIFIISCSDDDMSTPNLTTKEKLSGNSFLLTDYVEMRNGQITETYDSLDACDQDDLITFNADQSGSFDEGLTKCDSMVIQSQSFTWSVLNEQRLQIVAQFGTSSDTFELAISKNDGTILETKFNIGTDSNSFILTRTYAKQ